MASIFIPVEYSVLQHHRKLRQQKISSLEEPRKNISIVHAPPSLHNERRKKHVGCDPSRFREHVREDGRAQSDEIDPRPSETNRQETISRGGSNFNNLRYAGSIAVDYRTRTATLRTTLQRKRVSFTILVCVRTGLVNHP